jgi:hypothetical protein
MTTIETIQRLKTVRLLTLFSLSILVLWRLYYVYPKKFLDEIQDALLLTIRVHLSLHTTYDETHWCIETEGGGGAKALPF